jgi:hypothetical protein
MLLQIIVKDYRNYPLLNKCSLPDLNKVERFQYRIIYYEMNGVILYKLHHCIAIV